jgi:predicted neuraminidase
MKLPSNRPVLLGMVLLAFGIGFFKAMHYPPPALFQSIQEHESHHQAARFQSSFASSRLHVQTHAASLVELKDGRIRAFWFSGSREGAPDVEIHSSVYDTASGRWGAEQTVIDRVSTERSLLRYVAKLGNPVAARAADGTLQLFYVTVSLGGWAGSSITVISSTDEGETWSAPRRLVTSPFLNISTLVKGTPFLYADGTLGLPVYHEFISKFGELLRLDKAGAVIDKQRLVPGGWGALQPVVLAQNDHDARVLMRHAGRGPRRVVSVVTQDAGAHWSVPQITVLPNPDSALSAVVLPDGRMLAALNDIEQGREALSLVLSVDGGATWEKIFQLEDLRGARLDKAHYRETVTGLLKSSDSNLDDTPMKEFLASVEQQACSAQTCHYEFSYPYLIRARNGNFHLVYTWNRAFIKHVTFNQAWLEQQAERPR